MKRVFVEFSSVSRAVAAAGVSDDALRSVQNQIMRGMGQVVPQTGGLRKIRCAAAGRGKRGGVRIIFADYPLAGICLMVAAFAKNEREDLDQKSQRELAQLKAVLDRRMLTPKGNRYP